MEGKNEPLELSGLGLSTLRGPLVPDGLERDALGRGSGGVDVTRRDGVDSADLGELDGERLDKVDASGLARVVASGKGKKARVKFKVCKRRATEELTLGSGESLDDRKGKKRRVSDLAPATVKRRARGRTLTMTPDMEAVTIMFPLTPSFLKC